MFTCCNILCTTNTYDFLELHFKVLQSIHSFLHLQGTPGSLLRFKLHTKAVKQSFQARVKTQSRRRTAYWGFTSSNNEEGEVLIFISCQRIISGVALQLGSMQKIFLSTHLDICLFTFSNWLVLTCVTESYVNSRLTEVMCVDYDPIVTENVHPSKSDSGLLFCNSQFWWIIWASQITLHCAKHFQLSHSGQYETDPYSHTSTIVTLWLLPLFSNNSQHFGKMDGWHQTPIGKRTFSLFQ